MPTDTTPTELPAQLRAAFIFQGLDAGTLNELARRMVWHEYAEGEIVFLEGDFAAGLYLVSHGWLKAVKTSLEGREQVLRYIGPGETFSEIGAFTQQLNPATAIALEPCGLWLLPRAVVAHLLRTQPEFAEGVIASLAARIATLVNMVADLSLHAVASRLARLLLDTAEGNVVYRPRWLTQAELAARLGTVPDVVQRALRDFEAKGMIQVERQRIILRDRAALERLTH